MRPRTSVSSRMTRSGRLRPRRSVPGSTRATTSRRTSRPSMLGSATAVERFDRRVAAAVRGGRALRAARAAATPRPHQAARCLVPGAVLVAVLDGGGFAPRAQWMFAALAFGAVALVPLAPGTRLAVTSPPVLALLGLGAAGALSALWTVGSADAALRWAAVCTGFAALAAAAAGARLRAEWVAAALAVVAAATGIAGLVGATVH